MKKQILSLALVTAIFIASIPFSFAEEADTGTNTMTLTEKQAYVETLGVTQETAEQLPEVILDDMIADGREVLSADVTTTTIAENPRLRGTTSDIKMVIYIYRDDRSSKTEDWLEIDSYALWEKTNPFFQFKDKIATAWNCGFVLKEDSCKRTQPDPATGTRTDVTAGVGVAHEVQLGNGPYNTIRQRCIVERATQKETQDFQATVSYAHKRLAIGGITVAFSVNKISGPTVGFSAPITVAYDTASPAYASFSVKGVSK
ncbi:hypothetical protein FACS1894217_10240 [Clostridia bacterium]|nr:hypothetical protein FACS1894217_10240 [Clostridia bacterium]